ncbi:uncharacterized protein rcan1b isoform X1 [Brachyhypopomus gauderio]|uniref:uncharacterized protein rcan1b isoform X1 n=1 Tax=Brachyhypopomus gauderio TaxID=698409 RepID=UPI004041250A
MQEAENGDGAATADVQVTEQPCALIACKVPEDVFNDTRLKDEFEGLFRPFDAGVSFQFFKSFRRVRINFTDALAASEARVNLHKSNFNGKEMRLYFAQVSSTSSTVAPPPPPVSSCTCARTTARAGRRKWKGRSVPAPKSSRPVVRNTGRPSSSEPGRAGKHFIYSKCPVRLQETQSCSLPSPTVPVGGGGGRSEWKRFFLIGAGGGVEWPSSSSSSSSPSSSSYGFDFMLVKLRGTRGLEVRLLLF